MSFFNKIKLISAPKTQDEEYEQANNLFKSFKVDQSKLAAAVKCVAKSIEEVGDSFVKMSTSVLTWCEEAPAEFKDSAAAAKTKAEKFKSITAGMLLPKFEPNFVAPLRQYDARIQEIRKLKEERNKSCKEFDKAREYVRILETAKKQKPEEIEKAKEQSAQAQEKYEASNKNFIATVKMFDQERRDTGLLAKAFQSVTAIFCKYIRSIDGDNTPIPQAPAKEEPSTVKFAEEPQQDNGFGSDLRRTDSGFEYAEELQDDGWKESFNPIEEGYGASNPFDEAPADTGYGSNTTYDDDYGKNPFD